MLPIIQLLVFCLLPINYHNVVLQCCSIISITIKGQILYHNLGFSLTTINPKSKPKLFPATLHEDKYINNAQNVSHQHSSFPFHKSHIDQKVFLFQSILNIPPTSFPTSPPITTLKNAREGNIPLKGFPPTITNHIFSYFLAPILIFS